MTFDSVAALILPTIITAVGGCMLFRPNSFDQFITGARSGLKSVVRLIPTLVALLIAIRMFSVCGAVEFATQYLSPLCQLIGLPPELIPLLLTRPFSGSAATAAYAELLSTYGADSFAAICASVIMGSSDTAVYVISVYLSSVGVSKSRHAYPCAAAVMLFCIFLCCLVCRLWFKA